MLPLQDLQATEVQVHQLIGTTLRQAIEAAARQVIEAQARQASGAAAQAHQADQASAVEDIAEELAEAEVRQEEEDNIIIIDRYEEDNIDYIFGIGCMRSTGPDHI